MIRRLSVWLEDGGGPQGTGVCTLRREFPTVELLLGRPAPEGPTVTLRSAEWWADDLDLGSLDARVAEAVGDATLRLVVDDHTPWTATALQMLTRYQSRVGRRNGASRAAVFDAIVGAHARLHDLSRPLVQADYVHALDTWQWCLRLCPGASLAAQVASLFHDVERLATEADVRVEQHAVDYQAFKDAHARDGAAMTAAVLGDAGADASLIARVVSLIRSHERPSADPEAALVADADALSFFSRNSDGFASYYGPSHTRMKVRYSLARLRPSARARLDTIRFRSDVGRLVTEALVESPPARRFPAVAEE